jgi:hypothetical protein
MSRAVDPKHVRKARKALLALKAQCAPEEGAQPPFSAWEAEFIEGVSARLETFGSAFADFSKGAPDQALSRLQEVKVRELAKKVKKARRAEVSGADATVVSAPAKPPRRGFQTKPNKRMQSEQ